MEPPGSLTDKLSDGMSKPAIKTAEIHADDHIGLAIQREAEQLAEQPSKSEIVFYHVEQTDYGMLCHIESKLYSRFGHPRPAGAKKARLKRRLKRLEIGREDWFGAVEFLPQATDEVGGPDVTAGFARD
jgi:hypothetical protein